ncbi:MAG: sigma-54 interaction domain-containing protein [Sarcina sp.]
MRFEIKTKDKIGITMEILNKIYNEKINLTSMTVFKERIYIKFENISNEKKEILKKAILEIEEVDNIKDIKLQDIEEETKEIIESMKIKNKSFDAIIGNSREIKNIKNLVATIAESDATVILRGESGTGKELFARAIHNLSKRKNNVFVAINCAALPEDLLESELFGYEKGAFTGAVQSGKEGIFKNTNGGTLFLDEIGELPLRTQSKLLRVLQEGKIRKIGSSKEEDINVRIVAATHKNLEDMIINKSFREDLYYRLNVLPIKIPSLKDRKEDIPLLIQFFIDKFNKKLNKDVQTASIDFIKNLMDREWKGNIRELQNIIERAIILCDGNTLEVDDLEIDDYIETCKVKNLKERKQTIPLKDILINYEKEIVINVYRETKSYRKTAQILGISHTAVMNKLKKYEIFNECK